MLYVPQPPDSIDNGPSAPGSEETSLYVSGTWVYRSPRFVWRPGFWLGYRPGFIWSPARYFWTPRGYVFIDGYWDYCLEDRGLLFAPVWFHRPWWTTWGWGFGYQPWWTWCCGPDWPFFGLFVRPGWGHYYWGNFFAPRFAGLGFHPWYDFGPRFHDPLFNYYRWNNRGNPNWADGLHNDFLARRNSGLRGSNMSVLRPLNQAGGRLATLTAAQTTENRAAANSIRELSANRQLAERRSEHASTSAFHLPVNDHALGSNTAHTVHSPNVTKSVDPPRVNTTTHSVASPATISKADDDPVIFRTSAYVSETVACDAAFGTCTDDVPFVVSFIVSWWRRRAFAPQVMRRLAVSR